MNSYIHMQDSLPKFVWRILSGTFFWKCTDKPNDFPEAFIMPHWPRSLSAVNEQALKGISLMPFRAVRRWCTKEISPHIRLPYLAKNTNKNKKLGCSINFEFLMNNKYECLIFQTIRHTFLPKFGRKMGVCLLVWM